MTQCAQCKKEFEIFDADREFYQKIDVPEPTLCPSCRDMRRWASGNDLVLYMCSCVLCGKHAISIHSPQSPYTVYCNECWWSDAWDSTSYGRDINFSKSFFEQFDELQRQVPRITNPTFGCEESPYVNNCGHVKRCYMCTSCGYCEECFYLIQGQRNRECSDGFRLSDNELCHELVNSFGNYHSAWLFLCEAMNDSYFCYDCKNCTKCIFSSNLRGKTLHIFNKPVSEEEYASFIQTLSSAAAIKKYTNEWRVVIKNAIHPFLIQRNCENTIGDYVANAVDSYAVYDCDDVRQVRYSNFMSGGTSDSMDVSSYGYGCENSYEGYGLGDSVYACYFTRQCFRGCRDVWYSDFCLESHDLFGCVGLRKKSWCIFNKQYSQEEYMKLKVKLIAHMRKTGEYGEYFPCSISPFGYNESSAMLYYPLSKEDALRLGYRWHDAMPETKGKETITWSAIPDSIGDLNESITDQILACVQCEKNYKIIKQELRLLKKLGIAIPRFCPLCRHAARIALRNPQTLMHRQCMCEMEGHGHTGRCSEQFETTYAPDRPEVVYCEKCYQREIA